MAKDYMAKSRVSMANANQAEESALSKPASTRDKNLTKVTQPKMRTGIQKGSGKPMPKLAKRMSRRPDKLA